MLQIATLFVSLKAVKSVDMKSLEEIFAEGRSPEDVISDFMSVNKEIPTWDDLSKFYEPESHPIVKDPTLRPKDKTLADGSRRDVFAKIAYPAEKIVTRRMVQMMFAIPVRRKYIYDDSNETLKAFKNAIEAVYRSVRINGVNKKRMRSYFASCEAATVWYAVRTGETNNLYGFDTDAKIRCRSYSPMDAKYSDICQSEIYPMFDDSGDMVALAFMYNVKVSDSTIGHFDCYTAENVYYYTRQEKAAWTLDSIVPNVLGKIPAAYICRPEPIYVDISKNRNEIEFTNSQMSDIVKKNAAPVIVVKGKLMNGVAPKPNEGREAFQVENGGDVEYLSSPMSIDQTIKHINTQKQMISEITQLPDLSLENVKGLGAISGEARKTLLMDAHLKVGEESDEVIWFLDREFNVIKALLASIHTEFAPYVNEITCTHIITPFSLNDKSSQTDTLNKQVEGKLKSHRTAMMEMGDYDDVDAEMETIREEQQEEADRQRTVDLFEGAR